MRVKILSSFIDKKDNIIQKPGNVVDMDEERVDEILSLDGEPLITVDIGDESEEFPKHLGKGIYELSNGEKVKGKEKAIEAQLDLTPEE